MKLDFFSIGFYVLLLCCIKINSTPLKTVEDSSIYKVMLSQLKLSELKDEKNGFDRILGLLDELINSASKSLRDYQSQIKVVTSNCSTQNATLTNKYNNLLSLKANYTKQIKNIGSIKGIDKTITNLTQTRNRLIREKEIFIQTFNKVYEDYLKFMKEIKKVKTQIDCTSNDFSKLFTYSVKTKLSDVDHRMQGMVKEDVEFCYQKLKKILVKIGELDTTDLCIYREQFEKNIKRIDLKSNYHIAVNATLEINSTLNNMNKYYQKRYINFTNANKTIFTYDTQVSNLLSLISNYKTQKANLLKLKETLKNLISVNENAIASSVNIINLLKKQCLDEISILYLKISTSNEQLKSYTELKLYFMNNYHKIGPSLRKKYGGGNTKLAAVKKGVAAKKTQLKK